LILLLTLHPVSLTIIQTHPSMGRIIAIDYGNKRVGLAVTDELRIIATALSTVSTHEAVAYLQQYVSKEKVDLFVVGLPMRLNFKESALTHNISAFIKQLNKVIPDIPVERYDERFTSKMAFQTMIDAGLNKSDRRDKALVDRISATIILQSYMEFLSNKH
jgi:putative holliday junction resolvase